MKLDKVEKNRELNELLDSLEFNQVRLRALTFCLAVQSCRIGCHLGEIRRTGDRIGRVACLL